MKYKLTVEFASSNEQDAIFEFRNAVEQIQHGHGTIFSRAVLDSAKAESLQTLRPEDFPPSTNAKTVFVRNEHGDDNLIEGMWKAHLYLNKLVQDGKLDDPTAKDTKKPENNG